MLPFRFIFEVSTKLSHAIASKMVLSYIPEGLAFMKIVCAPYTRGVSLLGTPFSKVSIFQRICFYFLFERIEVRNILRERISVKIRGKIYPLITHLAERFNDEVWFL